MKRVSISLAVIFAAPAFIFGGSAKAAPQIVWEKVYPGVVNSGVWIANHAFTYASPSPVQSNGGTIDIVLGSAVSYSLGSPQQLTPSTAHIYDGDNGNEIESLTSAANAYSVADVDSDGTEDIFIGSGGAEIECQAPTGWEAGLRGYTAWGGLRFTPKHFPDNSPYVGAQCSDASVFASPVMADIDKDGLADLAFGVLGLRAWATDINGNTKFGWPFYWDDTIYGSPALADITGDGQTEIIMPGDSSGGGQVDHRGGMVRAFTGKGQQLWEYRINEIVRSSPSIGDVTGDGDIEIVFGAGNYWTRQPGGASDCDNLTVIRRDGTLLWSKDLASGQIMASPTLADFNGDGRLDIAVGTWQKPCSGTLSNDGQVWVIDGVTGNNMNGFPRSSGGHLVIGQITTGDVNGDGSQDLLVPTANGIHIFDGENGNELHTLSYGGDGVVFRNSPLVDDLDSDGRLDIVVAGTKGDGLTGVVRRYEFEASDTAALGTKGWHMNRKDKRQTGSWAPPDLSDAPTGEIGKGYWMAASDGGVFPFGEARGYGSAGNLPLAQPIVDMESTPNGEGYWLVGADGGIFTYGNAGYFGSTGGIALTRPITAMSRTPTGNGYWLVASDGGVFPFGDAVGYGSTGNINLTRPMVDVVRTQSGNGYWLVASDGGVFPFGDAVGYGSTGNINLWKPIVSVVRTASGNGYWLIASDGGVFPFGDAVGYGSTGNINLWQPIVAATRSLQGGYIFNAADGGSFTFNAIGYGSWGALPLNRPFVGMAIVGGD